MLAPFLPFSSQQVHEMLGYEGQLFGDLVIKEYSENGRIHKGLTYDPTKQSGTWTKSAFAQGQKLVDPKPLYVKLDDSIIESERSRLGQPREEHDIVMG
jgi:methionyl-tRNA synthetase